MSLGPAQCLALGPELQEHTGMRASWRSRQDTSWEKDPEVLTLHFCPLPGSLQLKEEDWKNGQQDRTSQQPLTKSEAQILLSPAASQTCCQGWGGQVPGASPSGARESRGERRPSERSSLTPFSLSHLYMSPSHSQV